MTRRRAKSGEQISALGEARVHQDVVFDGVDAPPQVVHVGLVAVDDAVDERMGEPGRPLLEQRRAALEALEQAPGGGTLAVLGEQERLADDDVEQPELGLQRIVGALESVDHDVDVGVELVDFGTERSPKMSSTMSGWTPKVEVRNASVSWLRSPISTHRCRPAACASRIATGSWICRT